MSKVKFKYEILISGVYPFDGEYERDGFAIKKNILNEDIIDQLINAGTVYFSPYILMCSYYDSEKNPVYLTFEKEETVDIDYCDSKEYDRDTTNNYIKNENLFEKVDKLAEFMMLDINNDIKFPVKMLKAYDINGNLIALETNFINTSIASLVVADKQIIMDRINRQGTRMSTHLSYEKIVDLRKNNSYFDNALSMFYSSYSVSDKNVSFSLLFSSLESIFARKTYEPIKKCDKCGQDVYKISSSVAENTSKILLDSNGVICKETKKLYGKRSEFLHEGQRNITQEDLSKLQEYVRKVLLMYWYISVSIESSVHKQIIEQIQSDAIKDNAIYKSFLIALDAIPFEEKRQKILVESILSLVKQAKIENDIKAE